MSETHALSIVSGPAGVSAEWLTGVLRTSGALASDASVTDVALEPVGEGMMARSLKATLAYDPEGAGPPSVVVKYATDDPGSLGVARAMRLYELETAFYSDVAPLVTAHVPACHFSAHDPESGMFTLVLEDVGPFTEPGDVLTLATPEEARAVLSELVGIQAPTWDNPHLLALPWLADSAVTIGMFDHFSQGIDLFLGRFGDRLADAHVAFFERVLPKSGQWARSWSAPTVLQHGDFRTDNVMWGKTDADPAVTIIDFQTARLGPPGVDPAYFIGASLSVEDRRSNDQDLIRGYHEQLLAAGVQGFDFDACWRSYREGALYGVFLFVGTAGSVQSTERGDKLIVEQIARYASMAIDLESAEAAELG